MAKATKAATVPNGTAAEGGDKPKGRKPGSGDDVIYWDGARDTALLQILFSQNGQLSAKQVVAQLATHASFAGEVHLLASDTAPEKIRQRVKKLSTDAEEAGLGTLSLRRSAGAGYDRRATVLSVLGALRGQQAPVATAPVPTLPGGLIPTT